MKFNEKTRELRSSTGFLKEKATGDVYDYGIFLGKFSKPDDYEEINKSDYESALKAKEERENADRQEVK